ncbi:MAG: hypothetical protein SH809_20915 [Rhodothermales bacterium]|nr:hypothetical protein [Rhodothermales bacterium]
MNDLHSNTSPSEEPQETITQEATARARALLDEARSAYARARQDLSEATERLRGEIRDFDAREAGESARQWVRENPGFSLLLAAGAGVLLGKVLTDALHKDPPTFTERLQRRAGRFTSEARRMADHAADRAARQLAESSDYAVSRARTLGGRVHEQAGDLSSELARQASERGADSLRRASDWIASLSESAQNATHSLQHAAREASAAVAQRVPAHSSLRDGLQKAVQTIMGVIAFKKVSDWIKERY